jgi:hypothetical protein
MVNFDPSQDKDAKVRIDRVWRQLSGGGNVLMPLDKYPFSERYGWYRINMAYRGSSSSQIPKARNGRSLFRFFCLLEMFTARQKRRLTYIFQ